MPIRLLVSTRKGLFIAQRGPRGFTLGEPAFLGAAVSLAMVDPRDGALYAALEHGHFGPKLQRSDDGGRTWQEVGVPVYPKPRRGECVTDDMGRPVPWSTSVLWALEIDPLTDGGLWCGTVPGGLFHSADRGATWRLVRSLWDVPERRVWSGVVHDAPGLHSVCVDPRDPRVLLVGVSTGGVWQSLDHGASWQNVGQGLRAEYLPRAERFALARQDVHRLVQCPARPDRVWCQHHNGIFRSDDGGTTFVEVSKAARPSAFGFAVAVHPRDPDVAWFVPAVKDECRVPADGRLAVTVTRDGGRTFRTLTRGLPRPAYDLVLRHALDVDETGERLALGSSTGGLWVSEDGGASFTCVSAHLPPIYAVRFVPQATRRARRGGVTAVRRARRRPVRSAGREPAR
ncbi:MAG TPA: exo-alpha-sialidase [Planctomycetota bacterium]|nr:exo-alpha-sialidase [Planctomycetota bacterium]